MKKVLLTSLLLACVGAFATESAPLTKIFSYQGKTYQTSIAPSGLLYKGTFGKTEVFRSLSVVGNYIDTSEKYDTRLFQQSAKEVSATVEELGNNRVRIVSTGTIGNKKYPEAATYRQTTLFEPEGMKIDYQFTSKVPMATRMDIFGSLMNLPLTAVIDRGMACATAKAKNELISIPATCEKGKGIHKGGFLSVKISYPEGIFQAVAGEKTSLSLKDCRNWGEKNFRLDGTPVSYWKNKPETYPAGKVWSWSVEYRFTPHED